MKNQTLSDTPEYSAKTYTYLAVYSLFGVLQGRKTQGKSHTAKKKTKKHTTIKPTTTQREASFNVVMIITIFIIVLRTLFLAVM